MNFQNFLTNTEAKLFQRDKLEFPLGFQIKQISNDFSKKFALNPW